MSPDTAPNGKLDRMMGGPRSAACPKPGVMGAIVSSNWRVIYRIIRVASSGNLRRLLGMNHPAERLGVPMFVILVVALLGSCRPAVTSPSDATHIVKASINIEAIAEETGFFPDGIGAVESKINDPEFTKWLHKNSKRINIPLASKEYGGEPGLVVLEWKDAEGKRTLKYSKIGQTWW